MAENCQKQLDCLLIAPPMFYGDEENIWQKISSNFPPLGLASIAGYLRSRGFKTRIIDCNIASPTVDQFERFFQENYAANFRSIKYIGFTATTVMIKKSYQIAQICKKYFPQARIVYGGAHATFLPAEVLSRDFIDIAVIGEGELTMAEIIADKPLVDIKGIAYPRVIGGERSIIFNEPRPRIIDLNNLPIPAYDLLPIRSYKPAKGSYKRLPAMSMVTSRGCPGQCTFCSKILGSRIVFLSAEKIFAQIKYLINNYNIKQILFYDDTFTVNKANVIKLCDLLLKNKIDLSWTCFARVDFVDLEMLKKMKLAGCHQIMYGVENIDEAVLKNINKKINLEQVKNAVGWTKTAGLECRLAFMVGNPGDNREVLEKNIKFINKINPDLLVVNVATPFPGTAMFKWADEHKFILTYDWDDYDLAKPVMRLENLTADQIRDYYREMYRRFYFRPGYILKKILAIRSYENIKAMFGGFLALLSFSQKK